MLGEVERSTLYGVVEDVLGVEPGEVGDGSGSGA
jgi:hypothetical protein